MDYKNRLLNVLLLSLFLIPSIVQSQIPTVKARPVAVIAHADFAAQFKAYQAYHIQTQDLVGIVYDSDFNHQLKLELPGYGNFTIDLFENPMQAPNYLLSLQSENGLTHTPGTGNVKTFVGNLEGGQYVVSLTIDQGFIQGFIQLPGNDRLQIEPLRRHLKSASRDEFVVYRASDRIETQEVGCEIKHHPEQINTDEDNDNEHYEARLVDQCRTVQIAFANDWLMFDDYNEDVEDVENHNLAVINDVQNNFDTEFADDLTFAVVQIWISQCSSCDPWTNSTNPGMLLDDFTDWGPSGFSNIHDVANLWTDRDFNGGTIGISWIEAVCQPWRYLTCQDFSENAGALRTLLAHELGHNFGSGHDAPGSTIMAPSLVITNTWSASSINQINDYLDGINCLALCVTLQAPVANFSSDDEVGCDPFTVHFFDDSTGPPTSWDWTFPGGTPSTSTQANPTVTYQNPGLYDVVLEVSNSAGSHTIVRNDYITVLSEPTADFSFNQIDLSLIFTNLSDNGEFFWWDFGDGSASNQQNPTHTYEEDGEYEITLEVTNDCGTDIYTEFIEVFTLPTANFSYSTNLGCAPLVVQFFNESSENVQDLQWLFPGGSPSSSTQENPVVTYQNAGLYDVILIVENVAGVDELEVNNLIEVEPLPEADFNFAVNGLSVQFVNASLDAESYLWTFGDGGSSTSPNPNHIYLNGGAYVVTLAATNDCGTDLYTTNVTLNSPPVAGFITSISSGCLPLSVTYTSISLGQVTSYNWSFPGGQPAASSASMPTVVYQNPGTYDAQLIVGNAIGFDTILLEDVVSVVTDVQSGFVADIDGATVDFLNTSAGASQFNWLIDGMTFIMEDVTYTFPDDGDYPVRLIASGQCGSDTTIQIIHIGTEPTAGIASNTTSGCEPLTVQFFNASSSNATTFAWQFDGGIPSTSSQENPVVEYTQPGEYNVQLTVWSEAGMDVLEINNMIEVFPDPVSSFQTIQTGLEIQFINNSQHATEYLWDFGDGFMSTGQNPIHVYNDFGTYTVTLFADGDCGIDELTIELTISSAPVPMFNAAQTNGCVPFEVQFNDMSQNGAEFWEWTFPGGQPETSTLQNPVVVYDEPGLYSITLRVNNAGGSQTLVRNEYIHVAYPPEAEFSSNVYDATVSFANTSVGATEFFWFFGDGLVDTAASPVHTYALSGTYQVMLIATNPCSSDTLVQDVTVTVTGLEDLNDQLDIRLYPNPNAGTFELRIDGMQDVYDLEVFDILGQSVLRTELQPSSSGTRYLSLSDAVAGVYTVVIRKDDFRRVIKMIVQ